MRAVMGFIRVRSFLDGARLARTHITGNGYAEVTFHYRTETRTRFMEVNRRGKGGPKITRQGVQDYFK
jgi:hypothetical protein